MFVKVFKYGGMCSDFTLSSIDMGDPIFQLVTKKFISEKLIGKSPDYIPDLAYVHRYHRTCHDDVDTIKFIKEYRPDIFICYKSERYILEEIKYEPELVIILGYGEIDWNGNVVSVSFSDLTDKNIKSIIKDLDYKGDYWNKLDYWNKRNYVKKEFNKGYYHSFAYSNILNESIDKYLFRLKDSKNPAISVAPRDDKTELLELVSTMRNQLNELEQRIKNM